MLQGIIIFITGGFLWGFFNRYISSMWMLIPIFGVAWFMIGGCEMALIGLLNADIRLASKLGIKVENLNIYRKAFDKLVEAEMRGENTKWIGDTLPDQNEWLSYLRYEIENGLKETNKASPDYSEEAENKSSK